MSYCDIGVINSCFMAIVKKRGGPFEQDIATENQITAGVSMFYFEEEMQS